jgi:SAM-dependent methyltransferase
MTTFSSNYSNLYDVIHKDKNYKNDVDKIEILLSNLNLGNRIGSILDFGCGTGKHLSILDARGYKVQGYDPSTDMIERAKSNYPHILFANKMEDLHFKFDLVISLFDVLSYQCTSELLNDYFEQLLSKVAPGGYIIVDFWNLNGVQKNPPENRTKIFDFEGNTYKREVCAKSSDNFRVTDLEISITNESIGLEIYSESHKMRAIQSAEIQTYIEGKAKVIGTFDATDYVSKVSDSSWRAVTVIQSM